MKFAKNMLSPIVLTIFSLISVWGITLGMISMDHAGHLQTPCPFMQDQQAACRMNAGEHLTFWKQAFTAAFQNPVEIVWLGIVIMGMSVFSLFDQKKPALRRSVIPPGFYERRKRLSQFKDPIWRALSQGILEPQSH